MMTAAALLFLLGCVTVIYPIRAIGLSRRSWGVLMIVVALVMSIAASPELKGTATSPSPGYQSSGSCKTDALGTYRCDSEATFGGLGASEQLLQ